MVEQGLDAGTSFMNAHGLVHFDAHFENILTDGHRLYFGDYGLALSCRFDLTQDQAAVYDQHLTYDRCYTASYLVHRLVTALYGYGYGTDDRDALIRACAEGEHPAGIPEAAATILTRYAPLSLVMWDFIRKFPGGEQADPLPTGGDPSDQPARQPIHRLKCRRNRQEESRAPRVRRLPSLERVRGEVGAGGGKLRDRRHPPAAIRVNIHGPQDPQLLLETADTHVVDVVAFCNRPVDHTSRPC
ncbi:hypothetical protein [Streptomyces cucumeris]|uniref:hypothetical protein n=1 Tax=Streptomyces cucumeris TaxID=2962890 RepID=UPI003EC06158